MIVEPTKCPQLEGSSTPQKMGNNWCIAQPTKCTQLGSSSNQQKKVKLDDCTTDKMPPIRRF